MAVFKSATTFKGKKENKTFKAGEPFEMTIKRAEEIQKNVKEDYGIDLQFERLDEPEKRNSDEEKENETDGDAE